MQFLNRRFPLEDRKDVTRRDEVAGPSNIECPLSDPEILLKCMSDLKSSEKHFLFAVIFKAKEAVSK